MKQIDTDSCMWNLYGLSCSPCFGAPLCIRTVRYQMYLGSIVFVSYWLILLYVVICLLTPDNYAFLCSLSGKSRTRHLSALRFKMKKPANHSFFALQSATIMASSLISRRFYMIKGHSRNPKIPKPTPKPSEYKVPYKFSMRQVYHIRGRYG